MAGLGIIAFILFMAVSIVQIYAGFIGIEYHLGVIWAYASIAVAIVLRIMLPLTVGTFFGAMDVWGWEWHWAALLAAPGLLFIVPATITSVMSSMVNRSRR